MAQIARSIVAVAQYNIENDVCSLQNNTNYSSSDCDYKMQQKEKETMYQNQYLLWSECFT